MTYTLLMTPKFRRAFRKLPPQVNAKIKSELFKLENDPNLGKQLKGEYRRIRSLRIVTGGVHYRVFYKVDQTEIHLLYVDTRENIYQVLRRIKLSA